MILRTRHVLGWATGALLLIAASAQPAPAAGPVTPGRPVVPPAYRPVNTVPERRPAADLAHRNGRLPGWDWWRIYPWSPYNYGRNPYNPIWIYPYPSYRYSRTPYMLPTYPSYPVYGGLNTAPSASPPAAAAPSEAALDWPLALRILPPASDTKALRQDIDARLAQAQRRAAAGRLAPSLVQALDRDVGRLARMLREKADVLPVSRPAIADAESFLARLKDTIKTLR